MRTSRLSAVVVSAVLASTLIGTAAIGQSTTISSNFNGTSVTNPEYIWFTSHLTSLTGVPVAGGTLFFSNQTITIFDSSLPGGKIVLSVPNGSVTIDPSIASPTIVFDAAGSHTSISAMGNDPILSVFSWQVPLPTTINLGGANPVTWTGDVAVSWLPTSTVTMNWQWAAAVYTPFTTNYAALGVLPTDQNGFQSGTPMNYIAGAQACINAGAGNNCLAGGARGGTGSNYTGSNSGTASLQVTTTVTPEPSTYLLFGSGLFGLQMLNVRRRRRHA